MKTTDRHPEGASRDEQPDANVVRLPRDWLGPREELVPFGAGAASASPDTEEDGLDKLPAPEDFWSESSAAVQSAWMAPDADSESDPAEPDRPGPAPRDSSRGGAAAWLAGIRVHRVAFVIGVAALGLLALFVGGVTSSSGPRLAPSSSSSQVGLASTGPQSPGALLRRATGPRRSSHARARSKQHRITAKSHHQRTKRGRPATVRSQVSYHPSTSSSSASPTAAAAPTGVDSASSGSSSGSSSVHSSAPAGPVGPGAPFAPGHMG